MGEHHQEDDDAAQRSDVLRRLYTATCLCFAFLVVEVIGGYLSGSLAVLSDAAHLFADLASFGIAIVAAKLAAMPTTDQHTFGLKRSESLAALFSMLSLALVSIGLAFEAVRRLWDTDKDVDGKLMSGIAAIGVFVNIALAFVLGVEHHVHLPGGGGHDHSHGHCGHSDDNHDDLERAGDRSHGHGHDHSQNGSSAVTSTCTEHGHSHSHGKTTTEATTEHDHSHAVYSHGKTTEAATEHDYSHSHTGSATPCGHAHSSETSKFDPSAGKHYQAVHVDEVIPTESPPPAPLRNINLQAAYLHVLGDLAQSVAVLIAGLVIWLKPEWKIVDPICTLFFCALVFYSTLGVLRSSISVLLEEVPPNIQWRDVFDAIASVDNVDNVHELHIWSISHGTPTLSVHCSTTGDQELALERIYCVVKKYGISHATIQVQSETGECITCNGLPCDALRTLSK